MYRIFSGYCVCVAGFFVISLVLLGSVSNSYYSHHGYSVASIEFQSPVRLPLKGPGYPPILAYWILGTGGDGKRLLKLAKAVYHPRNQYLLQLDAGASAYEREALAFAAQSERVFRAFANVNVIGKSYAISSMGSSSLAATLHAAALLLRINADWDWFITLSASDYPIMTQDDILYAFSSLPKDLNFISYNNTHWKEQGKINQIVIDPSLYNKKNSPIFSAAETRPAPDAFKVFGGSPWITLSRSFMDYCVHGSDNLPRTLLMYFSNVASPLESYFHTILCNSPDFQNNTINRNLWCILEDAKAFKNSSHIINMLMGEVVLFMRPSQKVDKLQQIIDVTVLNLQLGEVVPGFWCSDKGKNSSMESSSSQEKNRDPLWGDIDVVKPGPQGLKLAQLLSKFAAEERLNTRHCM
ncbi:hypothetical protein Ancab_029249 [Ancistrocladus abbreviatus]